MLTKIKKEFGEVLVWPSENGACQQVGGTRIEHSESYAAVVGFHLRNNGVALSVCTVFGEEPPAPTITYKE